MTEGLTKIGDARGAARPAGPTTPFAPFRHTAFTVLWLATVLSNVGTWMHDVAAGWLMTSLAPSPLMVALVQTATTLPVFLFALPAGALADILDRRRMLMLVQAALAVIAGALGVIVLVGLATPWLLLIFTFTMGTGAALTAPAWQAIVPRLVPRDALQPAVAMNSVGINISRAIGPALAGVIITAVGIALPFLINALSYLLVVAALAWWRQQAVAGRQLPPEQLLDAVGAGLRYARHSKPLKATLGRAIGFFVFTSAYWALLPLIVREELGGGAELYGIMLGCVGAGAVSGAFALPRLRAVLGADRLVALGTLGTALVLVVFATIHSHVIASVASLGAGACWIAVLTSLNVSAQTALPDWVRARGLSIFVTVFFGAMSGGSLLWGQTASLLGIPAALLIAAGGAVIVIPLTWRWKLQLGATLDFAPSMHWPEPVLSRAVEADRGPVLVTIEYRVGAASRVAFLRAIHALAAARRRDGAYDWGIFEDAGDDGRFVETFLVNSWLEHLRQHERVTNTDRMLQDVVRQFQIKGAPKVTHWIAAEPATEHAPE
ncbi:MAG: MFS transporter [Rhodospirillales bacterium]|nr:MFS transporter [Rhodospirillales bacterium]